MKRAFLIMVLLLAAAAWCQDASSNTGNPVVIESVDEDIVDDPVVDKDTSADKEVSSKDTADEKDKGLDLDALLADDDDDLLVEEDPAVVKTPADSVSSLSDTGALAGDGKAAADSAAQAAHGDSSSSASGKKDVAGAGKPAAKVKKPVDSVALGPVVIEDGRTINFAQNLKEYRSPRLAMLMSLLVPGLGQAYARSYIKAGAFGAAEIAGIGLAVYFNSAGKKEKRKAYRFADQHFDSERLYEYGDSLASAFNKRAPEGGWDDTTIFTRPYHSYNDTAFRNAAEKKTTFYYESIRGLDFTPGWDDNELTLDDYDKLWSMEQGGPNVPATGEYAGDSEYRRYFHDEAMLHEIQFYMVIRVVNEIGREVNQGPMLGYSKNQASYNSKIEKANSYYDAVNYTLYALVLNHIASAIDAGFTARSYNARLLGQESSVWDRFSVEQQYVFTGSEVSPGLALRVRF